MHQGRSSGIANVAASFSMRSMFNIYWNNQVSCKTAEVVTLVLKFTEVPVYDFNHLCMQYNGKDHHNDTDSSVDPIPYT